MNELTTYLFYEMIMGVVLGYLNDTVNKVPPTVRRANLTGRIVCKAVIQIVWKLICITM
jgi:hypothetical protein